MALWLAIHEQSPPCTSLPCTPSFETLLRSFTLFVAGCRFDLAANTTPILLRIFPSQRPDVITEFQETLFPPSRLRRRVIVKASGVRNALGPGLDKSRYQGWNLLATVELRQKIAHDRTIGRDSGKVHESEWSGKSDPISQIV